LVDCSPFSLFGNSTIDKPTDSPRISNGNYSKPSTPLISPSTVVTKHQSPPLLAPMVKDEKLKKENADAVKNEGETTPSSFKKNKRRIVETSESDSSSSSGSDSNSEGEVDPLSKKATQKDIERREKLWENLKQQLRDSVGNFYFILQWNFLSNPGNIEYIYSKEEKRDHSCICFIVKTKERRTSL
jgi:hypothetical protein